MSLRKRLGQSGESCGMRIETYEISGISRPILGVSICNIDLGHLTASTIRRIMSGRVNTYAISVTISAYVGDKYGDLGHISAEIYEYIYGPGQYRNSVATHDQSWPINDQS